MEGTFAKPSTQHGRNETMINRYDIYEAWNGSMNIVCLPRTGEWVTYEDHAKEIDSLQAELRLYKLLAEEK